MSTAISVLGGVGLFLLGMTVMTGGLKAMAAITLLEQSSSATTMTTIGLVSAGLLTFTQGLGLVFGAKVGTTATGWLVIGVRVGALRRTYSVVGHRTNRLRK